MSYEAHSVLLRDELMTSSPAGMVVLIYEEAIRALKTAIRAVEAGDITARHANVSRAMDVIAHLYGCLDMENGGEIAENLGRLYRFVLSRLVTVEPTNDPAGARDAIRLLEPLLLSWRAIDEVPAGLEMVPVAAPAASEANGAHAAA